MDNRLGDVDEGPCATRISVRPPEMCAQVTPPTVACISSLGDTLLGVMTEEHLAARPSGQARPTREKLRAIFDHPGIRIVERLAALASIPLAVLLYFAGVHKPNLSYYLHQERTKIVSVGGDPLLQVSYAGEEIRDDITAVQLAIWNAGSAPIRASDLLQVPTLTLQAPAKLLSAKILETTRSVNDFRLNDTRRNEGLLSFSWTILEEGDGAKIQILFAGPPEAQLRVSGAVVGQPSGLREFNVKEKAPVVEKGWRTRRVGTWMSTILIVVAATMFPWGLESNFLDRSVRFRRNARRIGWLLTFCFYVLEAWILFMYLTDYSLPFTF